jgi:hypothetical protein
MGCAGCPGARWASTRVPAGPLAKATAAPSGAPMATGQRTARRQAHYRRGRWGQAWPPSTWLAACRHMGSYFRPPVLGNQRTTHPGGRNKLARHLPASASGSYPSISAMHRLTGMNHDRSIRPRQRPLSQLLEQLLRRPLLGDLQEQTRQKLGSDGRRGIRFHTPNTGPQWTVCQPSAGAEFRPAERPSARLEALVGWQHTGS